MNALPAIGNSETEALLETLCVGSPDLLMNGLTLIGRQLPTGSGPLDLLGVDEDGRLVVFELKRGVLYRESVAQVLDYASQLAEMDADVLAKLIETNSGQNGIEPIADFRDWYSQEFPNNEDPFGDTPRMVLVGLGVDDRARRIVDFLAKSGIDVQLLTFHGFELQGDLLLARQVEVKATSPTAATHVPTKESNLRVLHESARGLGVEALLQSVAQFVETRWPGYKWPGKTAYSFSLQERTSEGRPTLRLYVAVYLNFAKKGSLLLKLANRAGDAAGGALEHFCGRVEGAARITASDYCMTQVITAKEWPRLQEPLDELLRAVVAGWRAASVAEGERTDPLPPHQS